MKFITIARYLKSPRVGYTAVNTQHEHIVCGVKYLLFKKFVQLV